MHQPLVGHRGQEQRAGQRLSQQLDAGMGVAQIGHGLRNQPQRIQCRAVVRQRQVLVGTTLDVLPGLCLDVVNGMAFVIRRAADVCRNLRVCGAYCFTQGVAHGVLHQACDHMRSRL